MKFRRLANRCITVSQKGSHQTFGNDLSQILTDFQNSFTAE